MYFPLTVPDVGLLLAVVAIVLLATSELLYSSPSLSMRILLDKRLLRLAAVGCGVAFLLTILMRVAGMG